MTDRGPGSVLGVRVKQMDQKGAVDRIIESAKVRSPLAATALAVHGVMTGVLDGEHRWRLNELDLVLPDGQPVRWALNMLYSAGLEDRVYGPDLMLSVCRAAAEEGLPIFLYGSSPPVLSKLCDSLAAQFPSLRIAGARPSLFRTATRDERAAIAAEIRGCGARLVFVGLGCPRQETWVFEQREILGLPTIAVGAAFDFHAGCQPQAPRWMQRSGLEWLFRLSREPRRLWKRYLLLNPLFVLLLGLQAMRILNFSSKGRQPQEDLGPA